MPVLLENPWISLHTDAHAPLVRYTRTAEPYPSLDAVVDLHEEAARVLDRLGRKRFVLLADMRASPLNNDPGFEQASARARDLVVRGFSRVAVLVRTAVGSLQVKRHIREGGHDIVVFHDEAEAVSHLLATPSERPPPESEQRSAGRRPLTEPPPASSQRAPASSQKAPSARSRR
ncbi:MAG: hypothetical protein U0359_40825 [Byssovorax sp.]